MQAFCMRAACSSYFGGLLYTSDNLIPHDSVGLNSRQTVPSGTLVWCREEVRQVEKCHGTQLKFRHAGHVVHPDALGFASAGRWFCPNLLTLPLTAACPVCECECSSLSQLPTSCILLMLSKTPLSCLPHQEFQHSSIQW
jgi:hypothetical protein